MLRRDGLRILGVAAVAAAIAVPAGGASTDGRRATFVFTMSGSSTFAFSASDRIEGGCATPAVVDLKGSQTISWATRPIRVTVTEVRSGRRTVPVFETKLGGTRLSTDPRRGESFNLPVRVTFERRIEGVMADGTCAGTERRVDGSGCGRRAPKGYAAGFSPAFLSGRYEFRVFGYPDPFGKGCDIPTNNISDEPARGLFPATLTDEFRGTWRGFFATPVGQSLTLRAARRESVGSGGVVSGTSAYRARFVFRRLG